MSISVRELRLSLVWSKTFVKDAHLPSLADPDQYRSAFDASSTSTTAASPWLLPWIDINRQRFWQFYLKGATTDQAQQVTSAEARSFLVPLRIQPFCHVSSPDGKTATLEGYCYPHSVAVIGSVRIRPAKPVPLADMVDAAVAARNADYNLRWHDSAVPPIHGALQSLADKVVLRVHAQAGIDANALGLPLPPPITTATVIDAEGDEPDDVLLRALHGLCWLRSKWQSPASKLVEEMPVPEVKSGIAIGKGRAIWQSANFSLAPVKGRQVSLGCYHRNLTMAAMQTAALAALVTRADDILADPGGRLIAIAPKEAGRATELLGKFAGTDFFTYRSWTAQYQASFYQDRIARVRQKLGL